MNVQQIIAVIREVQRQNNERNIPATSPIGMRVEDAIALVDHIERLEAVVRAGDDLAKRAEQTGRLIHDLAGCSLSSLHANDVAVRPMETSKAAYDAARSRVTIAGKDDNGTERKETKR